MLLVEFTVCHAHVVLRNGKISLVLFLIVVPNFLRNELLLLSGVLHLLHDGVGLRDFREGFEDGDWLIALQQTANS